jgi:glyoxylase-like metal-dependent hydrolase (beta-lactamase superfamily II)
MSVGAHHKPRLSVRQVADLPIWVLRSTSGRPLNSVVISGPDGLILVNTGASARHARAIGRQLADLSDDPVTTIIHPHHPTVNCRGTSEFANHDDAAVGNVVILAAGRPARGRRSGVAPNLVIDRECVLRLSGVTLRLLPAAAGAVGATNIYIPKHRVAMIADESYMWAHPIRQAPRTPFAHAVGWFLRFPVEHLLGSHLLPLSGPEVNLVLRGYLDRPPARPLGEP